MAQPAVRRTPAGGTDQSIGDLVSVATRDISQLVRYELDLAKIELKSEVKRVGVGAGLLAFCGFVICLTLIPACFAYAYGLTAAFPSIHLWLSFIIVAATCLGLALIAGLIGYVLVRKMTGMSKTRRSLSESLLVVRRKRPAGMAAAGGAHHGGTAVPGAEAEAG